MSAAPENHGNPIRVVGRYALYAEIAAGGMATVHFGRLLGPVGFSRTVAIKRLHPQFAKDPEFVSMFLDEARLAARIRHPNVVPTLDVVATQGELFLVMDYVQGESLSRLVRAMRERGEHIPLRIMSAIVCGALHGLHAAHEAKNERGEPLRIVHRDISPQNILVGTDGVARVLDFGVAKASGRIQTTREGQLKGKLAYMAPEQIGGSVTRQTDIYAAAIVLWEAIVGQRLFSGDNEGQILAKVLGGVIDPPSLYVPDLPAGVDPVVLRGLAREPEQRFATAREFAIALEKVLGVASSTEVGEWVEAVAHNALEKRAEKIAEIESSSSTNLHVNQEAMGTSITDAPSNPSALSERLNRPSSGSRNIADQPVSQASQLSSISVSKPGEVAGVRPRRGTFIAGGIIAVLSVALIVTFATRSRTPSTATTAPEPKPSATIPIAPPPETVATPPPVVPAVGLPSATAPAHTNVAPHHTTPPGTTVAPPPTHTAAPPQKNCDPPYTLDAQGHKKWKPECM